MYGGGDFGANDFGNDYGATTANFQNNAPYNAPNTNNTNAYETAGGFHVDNTSPDGKANKRDKQSVTPCTIKQLNDAVSTGDNNFSVDNKDLHQVTIRQDHPSRRAEHRAHVPDR